jgi:hypothetical protein
MSFNRPESFSQVFVPMFVFRQLHVLLVMGGIVLCPYLCRSGLCVETSKREGQCCCAECQRSHNSSTPDKNKHDGQPAPGNGQCCACVCDGVVVKGADEDTVPRHPASTLDRVIDPAHESATELAVLCRAASSTVFPPLSSLSTGRAMRVRIRSFLI